MTEYHFGRTFGNLTTKLDGRRTLSLDSVRVRASIPRETLIHVGREDIPLIPPNCDAFAKINRPLYNTTMVASGHAGLTKFRFVSSMYKHDV